MGGAVGAGGERELIGAWIGGAPCSAQSAPSDRLDGGRSHVTGRWAELVFLSEGKADEVAALRLSCWANDDLEGWSVWLSSGTHFVWNDISIAVLLFCCLRKKFFELAPQLATSAIWSTVFRCVSVCHSILKKN